MVGGGLRVPPTSPRQALCSKEPLPQRATSPWVARASASRLRPAAEVPRAQGWAWLAVHSPWSSCSELLAWAASSMDVTDSSWCWEMGARGPGPQPLPVTRPSRRRASGGLRPGPRPGVGVLNLLWEGPGEIREGFLLEAAFDRGWGGVGFLQVGSREGPHS